ncbi:hypothetical protein [Neomoorella mulderi]|jgi:hypothetical protein|uniref:Uncharacterized protein n=1 Tax=Moorella mulderi DSM 14980 TaxID=1122241 RepID=A0A151AWT3_9FIRM|nr:hypothetical protein [Moorella mulderi]KYH32030.1 hypothetical protein MOMUL_19120 [Moorella mulderi DSM 14980]
MYTKRRPRGEIRPREAKGATVVRVVYAQPGEARREEAYRLLARYFWEQQTNRRAEAGGDPR